MILVLAFFAVLSSFPLKRADHQPTAAAVIGLR